MSIPFSDSVYVFTTGSVGVTTSRTSNVLDMTKRQQATIIFTGSGISSGNGVFTVDASNDNSYWITGITFKNAVAVSTSITAGVHSATISANGTFGAILPAGFGYFRVKVAVTTDGRYNAIWQSGG